MTRPPATDDLAHLFRPTEGAARRAEVYARNGKWVRLAPQASYDLTLDGCGIVRKLWCVFNAEGKPFAAMHRLAQHRDFYRNIWLHIAFDDSDDVQVSAPIADFFLFGHGDLEDVDSRLIQTVRIPPLDQPPYQGAMTCFAPMPFAAGAKISFVNRNSFPIRMIASFDWLEIDALEAPLYHFHATYRKRHVLQPMMVLDRRDVEGKFVGLALYVNNHDVACRWHEMPEHFTIDGSASALRGTGGEDYFCLAWGFRRLLQRDQFGVTCMRPRDGTATLPHGRFNPAGEYTMYRWHLHDWVNFTRSIRLAFGAGHADRGPQSVPAEFRSVAFWYGRTIRKGS